jgi:hypothetical protein
MDIVWPNSSGHPDEERSKHEMKKWEWTDKKVEDGHERKEEKGKHLRKKR